MNRALKSQNKHTLSSVVIMSCYIFQATFMFMEFIVKQQNKSHLPPRPHMLPPISFIFNYHNQLLFFFHKEDSDHK